MKEKIITVGVVVSISLIGQLVFGKNFELVVGVIVFTLLGVVILPFIFKKTTMEDIKKQRKESEKWERERQKLITRD